MPNDPAKAEQALAPNDSTQPPPVSRDFVMDWLDVTQPHVDIDLPEAPLKHNRGQWRESFEDQLSLLRPQLNSRLLDAMSAHAWSEHGTKGVDPIIVARQLSAELIKGK